MANASEQLQFTTSESVGNASQAYPQFPQRPTLPIASLIVAVVTGVSGTCANAVVFVVLVFARRFFGSGVNALIANQSVMDLFACVFLVIGVSMTFPGAPPSYPWLGEVGNNFVCFVFRYRTLAIMSMNAGKFGLAMIARRNAQPMNMIFKNQRSTVDSTRCSV